FFYDSGFTALRYISNNLPILTLKDNGNVGIGTTTPGTKLDVYGENGIYIRVSGAMPAGDGTQGLVGYQLANSSAGGTWKIYLADPDGGFGVTPRSFEIWEYPANLGTGGCCRARLRIISSDGLPNPTEVVIDSAGNVGIGTTTPAYKLDVVGDLRISGNLIATANTLDNCAWTAYTCNSAQTCPTGQIVAGVERYTTGALCGTAPTQWYQMRLYCCNL
ncbi:MAG: hypothetical protein ACP5PR_01650, partial [Minisyncoccia bacterium]